MLPIVEFPFIFFIIFNSYFLDVLVALFSRGRWKSFLITNCLSFVLIWLVSFGTLFTNKLHFFFFKVEFIVWTLFHQLNIILNSNFKYNFEASNVYHKCMTIYQCTMFLKISLYLYLSRSTCRAFKANEVFRGKSFS